jgi:hypothetical protein
MIMKIHDFFVRKSFDNHVKGERFSSTCKPIVLNRVEYFDLEINGEQKVVACANVQFDSIDVPAE